MRPSAKYRCSANARNIRSRTMLTSRAVVLFLLSFGMVTAPLGADPVADSQPAYAYTTNGLLDEDVNANGAKWKLLLDKSNLGGDELEAAELTMAAGTNVRSHTHGSVEV